MEGGFENYAASTLNGTLSTAVWSVSSNTNSTTKAILNNAAVARTGSKYASHTTQVATNIRLQSPTTATAANAPAPNTTYTVQYYYNTTTDQTASLQGAIYNTATDSKSGLVTSTYLSGVWVKATYTATTNVAAVVASANFAGVRHAAILHLQQLQRFQRFLLPQQRHSMWVGRHLLMQTKQVIWWCVMPLTQLVSLFQIQMVFMAWVIP
jgi:hypothetical protein